ncbi:MAG: hypothetical protein HY075_08825 [Deltaproteobacteria bacterium]|nr:hypothetical protein [Deltaproteobacteria bacterium]
MRSYNSVVVAAVSLLTCVACSNPSTSARVAQQSDPLARVYASSSNDSQNNSSSGGSSTGTTSLLITQFYPAAGTVSSLPATFQVTFNKTSLDMTSLQTNSNWVLSCGTSVFTPASVTLNGSVAVVNMGTFTSSATSCSFTVSAAVKDTSGNLLSGTRTAVYAISGATGSSGSTDKTPPTGNITSPLPYDRVSGSVTVSATASDVGDNQSGVASVEFWVDTTKVGTATTSPYQISFNASTVTSGQHHLSLTIVDKAGNKASNVDGHDLVFANYSYTTTGSAGGTGGSAFTEAAPSEYNLIGLHIRANSSIVGLSPIWTRAYNNTDMAKVDGAWHGGTGGNDQYASCPDDGNWRVVGVYGYYGSYVNQLGVICAQQYAPNSGYWYSTTFYSTSGSPFTLTCPSGKFVTSVNGRSGSLLDQIILGCQ